MENETKTRDFEMTVYIKADPQVVWDATYTDVDLRARTVYAKIALATRAAVR